MTRLVSWLILAGILASTGCKKDEPAEKTNKVMPAISATAAALGSPSVPAVPAECKKVCRIVGKCASKDGKCYAASVDDCVRSVACRSVGYCSLKDDLCTAVSNADCEKSEVCSLEGRCVAVGGNCENSSAPAASASNAPAK